MKTDIKKIHCAVAELDPKGESVELNMAMYVISLAMDKEYTNYEVLLADAYKEYEKDTGYSFNES